MADDTFWRYAPLLVGLPAWMVALTFIARTVRDWPSVMARFNERFRDRARISNHDWKELREQISWLSEEVKDCRKSEGEWIQRAIVAEAKLLGQGEVRQAAAITAAEVRADAAEQERRRKKAKPDD